MLEIAAIIGATIGVMVAIGLIGHRDKVIGETLNPRTTHPWVGAGIGVAIGGAFLLGIIIWCIARALQIFAIERAARHGESVFVAPLRSGSWRRAALVSLGCFTRFIVMLVARSSRESAPRMRDCRSALARCDSIGEDVRVSVMPPPTWFPDPNARHRLRYWDGQQWTTWVADAQEPFVEAGNAIVVRRDRSWNGLLRGLRVSIDGAWAGRIAAGETRSFPVDSGPHHVRVGLDWLSSREVEVLPSPDAYVRCRTSFRTYALTFIRPRRALELDTADSDDPRPNRALVLAGIASWVGFYGIVTLVARWIIG